MKTRKTHRTLHLHRESLLVLDPAQLAEAGGGCCVHNTRNSCPTACLSTCDSVCIC